MSGILERILEVKRGEVEALRSKVPLAELARRGADQPPPRGFARALDPTVPLSPGEAPRAHRVIAEVKKASPSKGVIRADFDPVAIARAYARGGASALSILTDEKHFQGNLEHLRSARGVVDLPILRKDFIIDPYQIHEARAAGADAILLILAALDDSTLWRLKATAEELGLDILWEVHDRAELERLLPFTPRLVGVNNRNLRTFEVSLETTRALLPAIPAGALCVSESGFFRRSELDLMRGWGVSAFLIGESLMRAPDPAIALRELVAPGAEDHGA